MYQKPSIQKFGTFRELTQIGNIGASDGATLIGVAGVPSGCVTDGYRQDCPTSS